MARQLNGPKTVSDVEDGDFISSTSEDITALQGDIDAEVSRITSEFGADPNAADYKIKYYKVVPKTGKRDWLFDIQPSELPVMAKLRDDYGTGDYESHIYKNGKLNRKFSFGILAPSLPKVHIQPQADMTGILRAMAEQQDRQFQQLKEIMIQVARPAVPSIDPVNMMTAMVSMMVQMKTLTSAPETGGEKAIEMLLRGLEMGKDLVSDRPTGVMDVLGSVVKEALPTLTQLAVNSPPKTVSVQPRLAAQQPEIQKNTSNIPKGENVNMQEMLLKKYLDQLCDKAAENRDPSLYAELILDSVPENVINGFLINPDPVSQLVMANSRVNGYRSWFGEMINNIRELMYGSVTTSENLTDGARASDTVPHVHKSESTGPSNTVDGNTGRIGRNSGDIEIDGSADSSGET